MEESNKVEGTLQASETEIVFWRSISNNNDPNEIELYLEEFPDGAYAKLARIKLAKIRGLESDEVNKNRLQRASQAQKERADLEAERDATLKGQESESNATEELEERKSKLEAELVEREQVYRRRIAEIDARREEESKVFAEVKAREKAKLESRLAKQEADLQLQLGMQKEELKKRKEAFGRKAAEAALLAIEIRKKRGSPLVPIGIVLFVMTLGLGGFYSFRPAPEPDQSELMKMLEEMKNSNHEVMLAREKEQILRKNVELARVAETEAKASGDFARQKQLAEESRKQEAELAKQVEEVKKREFEEKKLAEAQAKKKAELDNLAKQSDADKKSASERAVAEKSLADKVAADRVAMERATAEKVAAERAAIEKSAADKASAEKVAIEKAAAEKAAIEKAAAEKLAAAKSGWPTVGDRWTYDVREANNPEKRFNAVVEVKAMSSTSITDVLRSGNLPAIERSHKSGADLYWDGRSVFVFSPYLLAFEKLQAGKEFPSTNLGIGPCAFEPTCFFGMRVIGKETITVKAGTFDSWKITGNIRGPAKGGVGGDQELVYWYSERANHYVKFQLRRIGSGDGRYWGYNPEIDMELVSYERAATR